jgi:hypothetical protein
MPRPARPSPASTPHPRWDRRPRARSPYQPADRSHGETAHHHPNEGVAQTITDSPQPNSTPRSHGTTKHLPRNWRRHQQ